MLYDIIIKLDNNENVIYQLYADDEREARILAYSDIPSEWHIERIYLHQQGK